MSSLSFSQNDGVKGYRIDGDDVVFTFDKNDYEKATKDNFGDVIDFDDLDIKNVVVSGEFNNWSKDKWQMTKISDNKYELRKHLSDFTDEFSWEFKFVINNTYWAEPSKNIKNKVDAKDPNGSQLHVYNLRMFTAKPDENGNSCFKLSGFKNAKKVVLSGTFNRWDEDVFRMNKTTDGWELTLQLKPGDYEYKFIVDGNWMEDPNNPAKKNE
jgi:1,4-alpha-glucan branching enzyme